MEVTFESGCLMMVELNIYTEVVLSTGAVTCSVVIRVKGRCLQDRRAQAKFIGT